MVAAIVAAVFLVLAIVVALGAIKIVPQGREVTVERFGRYTRTLKPGISFLTPFVEGIGRRINMMEQVLDVPRQDVITKDNVSVQVDAIVFIQVMDASAAAYRVTNLDFAITQLTMTNLRTVVGNMELDEVLSQRDQINTRLLEVIDQATSPWGVKVARIEIKDLQPPPDITNAMARQMKAERERRAVITEADGEKQAAITVAEGQKQSAILQAEGRREAAFRDAEARERSAGAEAKATELVSNAISAGDVNAINYFIAQKYVEAFGKLAESPQQKTVIVPADMGSLVGSIAGIGELVKTAMAERSTSRRPVAPAAARLGRHGGYDDSGPEAEPCRTSRPSMHGRTRSAGLDRAQPAALLAVEVATGSEKLAAVAGGLGRDRRRGGDLRRPEPLTGGAGVRAPDDLFDAVGAPLSAQIPVRSPGQRHQRQRRAPGRPSRTRGRALLPGPISTARCSSTARSGPPSLRTARRSSRARGSRSPVSQVSFHRCRVRGA